MFVKIGMSGGDDPSSKQLKPKALSEASAIVIKAR